MRRARSRILWQLIVAGLIGVGVTFAVEHFGPLATTVVLFVLLTLAGFVLAGLVYGISRGWRMSGRWPFGRGNGGWFGGVREPRRPRWPFRPPRAATAEPERTASPL